MNPMKVLLVDDSKSARYALRLQLQRHGLTVETADAAESALERVKEAPPDAIFMDHTMPGMNGFEALEILKSTPSTAHIPVVMCTSNEDPDFIAQARKKGAMDILSKSTAPEKLEDLLVRLQQSAVTPAAVQAPGVPVGEAAPSAGAPAQAALTEAQIEAIVHASVRPLIEELGERLAQDIAATIDDRLATDLNEQAERIKAQAMKAQSEQAKLTSDRLLNDLLPQAIGQHLLQEKQNLDQTVQDRIDASFDALVKQPSFTRRLLDIIEPKVIGSAEQIATRQAAQIAATTADERAARTAKELIQSLRPSNTPLYSLTAGAALIGIASAALVFYLLS